MDKPLDRLIRERFAMVAKARAFDHLMRFLKKNMDNQNLPEILRESYKIAHECGEDVFAIYAKKSDLEAQENCR